MRTRTKKTNGQALVMVTLALFAMAGMMGLAVDLGWSFFVQKQAQAAADGAALAAVQEAVTRIGSTGAVSGFSCSTGGSGAGQIDCEPTPIPCASVASTSNLKSACLYAQSNGFTDGSSNQIVTVQSNDKTSLPPGAPGVNRIAYWVTVRTTQANIPQLFSFISGNTQGTVAAVATGAIVGSISPGSFYGMNHAGDCQDFANTLNCGLDLQMGDGSGKTTCPGGGSGQVCAPAGVILSSSCNTVKAGVCSQPYAAQPSGAGVETTSVVIRTGGAILPGPGTNPNFHDASGNVLTPAQSSVDSQFTDPTKGRPQPPLQVSSTMASCGVTGSLTGTLGPYQYYHYSTTDKTGKPIPDGQRLLVDGSATFSASGTCPGYDSTKNGLGGAVQSGSQFPTYVFYGGLAVNNGATMNVQAGQYLMAGVASGSNTYIFDLLGKNSTVQPTGSGSTTGTMFIFTDGDYPGLTAQRSALPNSTLMPILTQGNMDIKNGNLTLQGVIDGTVAGSNLPPSMGDYAGIVWWQDRRNSMVEYNKAPSAACADCTADDGTVIHCYDCVNGPVTTAMRQENHVTNTSPGATLEPGNANITLTGVYYQPRGAWLNIVNGTSSGFGYLQVITGALDTGSGNTRLILNGLTNPLITYKAALIQ